MSIYTTIYNNPCASRRQQKSAYLPGSGLHKHHIIPRHAGGTDDEENFTYLTVREHVIAHFLLWKIHNNPNDLRSMYMLGAELTPSQRQIVGIFCRDNKLGFHGASKTQRKQWSYKSYQKNIENNTEFAYWASQEGRKKRASLGGKASLASGNNTKFTYWASDEGRKKRASLGGQSHVGKKWIHKDGKRTRVPAVELSTYLQDGWSLGSGSKVLT